MSITTYSELLTAMENWLARTDLTSVIPDFIMLNEQKLNRRLFVRQMEQRSTVSLDTTAASPEFVALPGDFQSMKSLRISSVSGRPSLNFLSDVAIDEVRNRHGDATGQPEYFAVIGDELQVFPTPDSNYTLEMVYRKYIPALSVSNTTNWLLALAPDLYLYGSLMESSPYLKDDNRTAIWNSVVEGRIAELNKMGSDSAFNAGPLVIRQTGQTP